MAAGTPQMYNAALERIGNSTADWDADNHYWTLHTNAFTFTATNTQFSNVSASEVGDADYAKKDTTAESVSESAGTVTFDAADAVFGPSVTITARWIVWVEGTVATTAGTDLLVFACELDTGGDVSSTNGDFTIQWNASGIFTLS